VVQRVSRYGALLLSLFFWSLEPVKLESDCFRRSAVGTFLIGRGVSISVNLHVLDDLGRIFHYFLQPAVLFELFPEMAVLFEVFLRPLPCPSPELDCSAVLANVASRSLVKCVLLTTAA